MNVTRTLVTTLLISSVIMGFVEGLSTQSASGVITSYSTATSTYYSYQYGTTISTQFTKTSARTVTQKQVDGPYLKLEIKLSGVYREGDNRFESITASGGITNLMDIPVENGEIKILITNKDGTHMEEATMPFGQIRVGSYHSLDGRSVVLGGTFYIQETGFIVLRLVFVCGGIAVEAPVATYTYSGTITWTYTTIYTATYTPSELQPFLGSTGVVLLFAVAIIAVVLIVVAFVIRGKARAPTKKEEIPTRLATKACVKCAFQLSADAEYCSECGQKQT